jgi:hypothetical protein
MAGLDPAIQLNFALETKMAARLNPAKRRFALWPGMTSQV